MTIRPIVPLAANRGKFYSFGFVAFSNATPAQAFRFSLGRTGGAVPLRNVLAFHAQLATVAEGLLERIVVPYQSGTASFASFGALRGAADPGEPDDGLENLLRRDLSKTLLGTSSGSPGMGNVVQRDYRMNEIRRFKFADVWVAVNAGVRTLSASGTTRTIELPEPGGTVNAVVYPPCVPVSSNGGCHGFTGFATIPWRGATPFYDYNLLEIDLYHDAQPVLSFCIDGSSSYASVDPLRSALAAIFQSLGGIGYGCSIAYAVPRPFWSVATGILSGRDVFGPWPANAAVTVPAVERSPATLRANLDVLWTSQAILCFCAANFAKVPAAWIHPHAETTVTYDYTIQPDGSYSVRTSTSTDAPSGSSIEYRRGIGDTPAQGWDYEYWTYGSCVSEEYTDGPTTLYDLLRDPDDDGRYYTVAEGDLPEVSPAQRAEIARLQQELDNAIAQVADKQQAYQDSLVAQQAAQTAYYEAENVAIEADTRKRQELFAAAYPPERVFPGMGYTFVEVVYYLFEKRVEGVYRDPGGVRHIIHKSAVDVIAEIPSWERPCPTEDDARDAAHAVLVQANADVETAAGNLAAAQEAEEEARIELENYIDSLELDYFVTVNLARNEGLWHVIISGDNPFDPSGPNPIPAPCTVSYTAEAHLLVPSGTSSASTVTTWPAAAAFSGGYVEKEHLVVAERYDDDVHLYERETGEDGVERWVEKRVPPKQADDEALPLRRYRTHTAVSSGAPSANTASALAVAVAQEARLVAPGLFNVAKFTLPVPIEPTTAAEVRPTLAEFEHDALSAAVAVRLCFNRYRSKKLRDSSFPVTSSDAEDLDRYIPYKAMISEWGECWRYGWDKMSFDYSHEVTAHSQTAETPTFDESFKLSHSADVLLGVTWSWKSMPCETNE